MCSVSKNIRSQAGVFVGILSVRRKGIIDTQQSNAIFWYRRITEVALLLCLLIAGIWLFATYVSASLVLDKLVVSASTAAVAFVTLLTSTVAMALKHPKAAKWLTVGVVVLLSITILLSLRDTGDLSSPYLPLWVLAALFGAVAGIASFIPLCFSALLYGFFVWQYRAIPPSDWVVFLLVIIFPILIGLFIWIRRNQAQDRSNHAVRELASELHQESSKSSIILDAIADGVLVLDKNGIVELINPAAERIIGWGGEDAAKLDYRSVLKIIDNKDEIVDSTLDPVSQCLSTNQSVITDKFGIRTISGKQLLASIMASPLGEPASGVIVVFRDITAQRAEEREQAEFISTASHEMRTPVAAIEGYLGLALNPQTSTIDEKARMYLTKAHESAANLGRLFQDLLDISKLEDGRLNSKPIMVDVPSFVRSFLDDFANLASEKSLTLKYTPDAAGAGQAVAPIYYANVDLGHLHEILTNLVSNAIKYTKAGSVVVDVKGDNEHIFISVQDSGIGIPAEDISHLFQKFYRVDNTDTREIGGTGLGLYLARRLTESMRGRLSVTSAYGKGSTFTVELPRVSKEEAARVLDVNVTAPTTTEETIL